VEVGFSVNILILGPFAADPQSIRTGSEIRAHYISMELMKMGFAVRRLPRDLVPRRWSALRDLALLPSNLSWADLVLVVGVPKRRLAYETLIRTMDFTRKPIVFDFNDDPVEQYLCLWGRPYRHSAICEALERLLFGKASVLVFITETMKKRYINRFQTSIHAETVVVPNATDPNHFHVQPEPETPSIGYLGGVTRGRGLETILHALKILSKRGIEVRLRIGCPVGNDGNLNVPGGVAQMVKVSTDVDYAAAPSFLGSLQICVIPHQRNEYLDMIQPVKLFDYMAAGRAVVATDNPEQARVISETGAGIVVNATPRAFAEAIGQLLENDDLRQLMGRAGRLAVETKHNWNRSIRILGDILSGIDGKRGV